MSSSWSSQRWAPAGTTLVERLGAGSIFEIALVRDGAGRDLVAKRSAPAMRSRGGARALLRERDVLATASRLRERLPVPALVSWGTDEDGDFLVQTRAPGTPLRALVSPALSPSAWIELARTSSAALALVHEASDGEGPLAIVHGDISPDNVFFHDVEGITLIDFSNATFRSENDPIFAHARGTIPYAAPELARQEIPSSQATDTYALAATLFAVAVGGIITLGETEASRLLEVGTRGILVPKLSDRADIPAPMRAALLDALKFDPAERHSSSRELAERLK